MLDKVKSDIPETDHDPYTVSTLLNPFAGYAEMREMGPVVKLTKYDMYALTRYDEIKKVMTDDDTFPSGHGVMMNEEVNRMFRGGTLVSDGEIHMAQRRVIAAPLTPVRLKSLQDEINEESENLATRLVSKKRFDGVKDMAQYLPLTIVSNAVGLPEEGREKMYDWSVGMFNCFGPDNELFDRSKPVLSDMMGYIMENTGRGIVREGSWAEAIHDAADRGDVPKEAVPTMMADYLGPSLDTTASATASATWLFAHNPDQWDKVREDPKLLRNALNEVLRLETPAPGLQPLRQQRRGARRHGAAGRKPGDLLLGRGQSRPAQVRGPGPLRRDAQERRPAPGLRRRTASVRRHGPGPHGDDGAVHGRSSPGSRPSASTARRRLENNLIRGFRDHGRRAGARVDPCAVGRSDTAARSGPHESEEPR